MGGHLKLKSIGEIFNFKRRNKTFCEHCRKEVSYKLKKEPKVVHIKGRDYEIEELLSYCNSCGKEILVNKVMEVNLETLEKAVYSSNEGESYEV